MSKVEHSLSKNDCKRLGHEPNVSTCQICCPLVTRLALNQFRGAAAVKKGPSKSQVFLYTALQWVMGQGLIPKIQKMNCNTEGSVHNSHRSGSIGGKEKISMESD